MGETSGVFKETVISTIIEKIVTWALRAAACVLAAIIFALRADFIAAWTAYPLALGAFTAALACMAFGLGWWLCSKRESRKASAAAADLSDSEKLMAGSDSQSCEWFSGLEKRQIAAVGLLYWKCDPIERPADDAAMNSLERLIWSRDGSLWPVVRKSKTGHKCAWSLNEAPRSIINENLAAFKSALAEKTGRAWDEWESVWTSANEQKR